MNSTSNLELQQDQFKIQAMEAMISRLISCLVNERMVKANIIDESVLNKYGSFQFNNKIKAYCQLTSSKGNYLDESFIIGLKELSMIVEENSIYRIGMMDPMDISFPIYYIDDINTIKLIDLELILNTLIRWNNLDKENVNKVGKELLSCVKHQYHAYLARKPIPKIEDSAICWEQSIVEGHPTHPMNKARHAIHPIPSIDPKDDLMNPKIYVFAVPRTKLTVHGKYEIVLSKLYEELKDEFNSIEEALVLIHEVQIPNIHDKFPFARQLSKKMNAKAQAALRTVVIEGFEEYNFKLAIGVKVTSAMRTITPWTTHVGPHFKPVADRISENSDLVVVDEIGSIVSNHEDSDIAKHMACIIREDTETLCKSKNEKVIVACALTEIDFDGQYVLVKALNLDNEEKRINFFERYAKLYLESFVTPVFKYGFTYEAHLQNVLVRFYKTENGNYELSGFAVRDFGGVKVDQKQLKATTGLEVNVWNQDACQLAKDSEDMHHVAFHTMITMHLHRIIRALNLHYNGKGWNIVRNTLDQILPKECLTRELWLNSKEADFKAFITMKLDGLYRDYLYTRVPNLITYQLPETFINRSQGSPNSKFLNR